MKKNSYYKQTFAADLESVGITRIPVNIWDDYYEDGFVPKGEKQETYGYVESEVLSHELKDDVLHALMDEILSLGLPRVRVKVSRDPAVMGPFIMNDGEPRLFFTHLTHKVREEMVKILIKKKIRYEGVKLDIYSES